MSAWEQIKVVAALMAMGFMIGVPVGIFVSERFRLWMGGHGSTD